MNRKINVSEVLTELKSKVGSYERLARKLKVSIRTAQDWIKKPEGSVTIHQDNLDRIISVAIEYGIEPDLFAPSPPLWDFGRSFKENVLTDPGMPPQLVTPLQNIEYPFLGHTINSRFGASASVLTSSTSRIRFLSHAGCGVITYKTVRSNEFSAHPHPNIFFSSDSQSMFNPERGLPAQVLVGDDDERYRPEYGVMNRFGMPSPPPEMWQADFRAAKHSLLPGQLAILSVVGTANKNENDRALIKDFKKVVGLAVEAEADVIELNLSCPNCNGKEGELYHNLPLVEKICKEIRPVAQNSKLLLKIGSLSGDVLHEFIIRTAAFVDGYVAINTLAIEGVRRGQIDDVPAFGTPSLKAGISGKPILRFGLKCVREISEIKAKEGLTNHVIIGVGGISTPVDVQSYLDNGADVVQATTAFFVDSLFAIKVRRFLSSQLQSTEISADAERDIARWNWSKAVEFLEQEYSWNEAALERVQELGLRDYINWERGHRSDAALGPRRGSVPTINEFIARIREQIPKG